MGVERFGVSIEKELLSRFDRMIKDKGYTNRSEAIRDLIRDALLEREAGIEKKNGFGALTIVYDHDAGNVVENLLHLQHEWHANIISTTHIHLSEHLCMELIALRGEIIEMNKIADHLRAQKGVLHGKLMVIKAFDG
ncbi:MAG: nickel-responsive transcriptional regulator NikR [Thermoplasmata archaeon]|nr:nickel-responsive transcriptional regulator NikR [Thermoplasmata archaeon]